MKESKHFYLLLIVLLLDRRQTYGAVEGQMTPCGYVEFEGPPCPIGDPNYRECGVDPETLNGVILLDDDDGDGDGIDDDDGGKVPNCYWWTPIDLRNSTCNLSCKSCLEEGRGIPEFPGVFPGYEEDCIWCNDDEEVFWNGGTVHNTITGYCQSSRCATEISALETCLSENNVTCPVSLEELQAFEGYGREPDAPYTNPYCYYGDGDFECAAGLLYDRLLDNICNPIVGLMGGLAYSSGANSDCPCSPQLYEQMYCLNSDKVAYVLEQNRVVPPTSSNPREEVCGGYAKPLCAASDVNVLLGTDAEGCLDDYCNVIPDCKCNKYCKTCGWFGSGSLEDVWYWDDDKKKGAGESRDLLQKVFQAADQMRAQLVGNSTQQS